MLLTKMLTLVRMASLALKPLLLVFLLEKLVLRLSSQLDKLDMDPELGALNR
nr:hypothetical protein Q903MT_gene4596 [Picea sitchensis]